MADNDARTNIRVCVRFRPPNTLERQSQGVRCIDVDKSSTTVTLLDGQTAGQPFSFDRVFSETATQEEVYRYVAHPLVQEVIEGYNCTIFAYGQTGSGKTHTMMGQVDDHSQHGVIPRIIRELFAVILQSEPTIEYTVKASYLELYLERIHDLLNPAGNNLRVREDPKKGVYVEGMTEVYVGSTEEMLMLMAKGSTNRAIASTRMNQESSRSHSIFGIEVERHDLSTGRKTVGKMYLVDLAGSEMVGKTHATGQTLQEAKMINRSLSSLGNVIKALTDGAEHIPYRDSKLTRVLQDSLGGNAKTSLIITASSSSYNVAETLSTLRFGTRAKRIKNRPKVNQERSIEEYKALLEAAADREAEHEKMIKRLQAEVSRLKLGRVEDTATDAADIRNEDLDDIDEKLTASLETCGTKGELPAASPSRLERIHQFIRAHTQGYLDLKSEFEALRDAADEREIELEEIRLRENEALKELEFANQKWQEMVREKEDRDAKMADVEAALRHNDFVRKENRLLVSQLDDDLEMLMRGHQYGLDMDLSSIEPRCRAALRRLEALFSRDTPDASDDESETGTQASDMASIDGDAFLTPTPSHRKKKHKQTRREMELESDVQTLTARMVELRTQLEAERENVAQLYEALDKGASNEQITSKLAQELLELRQALDRKSQQHQQLSLMFQNSEATCKKMQERINNREEQIQNLEHSLAEFQQTHRRTVEELTDRLQLYEAQLKALAIADAPPMSRARLVKSIRGSQRLLGSELFGSDSFSDETSPKAAESKEPSFAAPSTPNTADDAKLVSLTDRLRKESERRPAKPTASPVRVPPPNSSSVGPVRAVRPARASPMGTGPATPAKNSPQRAPVRATRDGATPVSASTPASTESSPQPEAQSEGFVARALRSLSASRGGRAENAGAPKTEEESGGILGTIRRRTSFRSNSGDTTPATPATPSTPEQATPNKEESGVMSIFRRRPSFTQTKTDS